MDADGSNIVTLGSGFSYPSGVAIQADDKILVADNYNNAIDALLEAWAKLLKKEVEQTKLALLAEKIMKSKETKEPIKSSIVHKIKYDGKVAGNIKFDHNTLKVSLKISQFDDKNLQELESLLKKMLVN